MTDENVSSDVNIEPNASDTVYLKDPFSDIGDISEIIKEQSEQGKEGQEESPPSESSSDLKDETENKEEQQESQEEDVEEEKDLEESNENTEQDIPTYKVKINGQDVDVPENATIKIKIDGKSQLVSVKDLVSDYNGRVVWANKFSELGRQKKALEAQRASWVQEARNKAEELNLVVKQLENKNPLGAIVAIANLQGLNAKEQVANFIVQADQTVKEWLQATPEARKQLLDAIELEQYKQKELKQNLQKQTNEQSQKFWSDTENIVLASGFTMQEFSDASNYLIENQPEIFPENPTQEEIRDIVLDRMKLIPLYVEVEEVASKVNPQKFNSFNKKAKEEFFAEMLKLRQAGIWNSADELKEILSEVLGKPASKKVTSLESQKSASEQAKTFAPKGSEQKKAGMSSLIDEIIDQVRQSEISTSLKSY